MSRPDVPFRSRGFAGAAALALIAITASGCSDSGRFTSDRQAPPQEVTGSIAPRYNGRVVAQPLPAPSRPATTSGGVAYGAQGLGAYRPAHSADVTGSVVTQPPPAGHWTWDGGSAVTVTQGETIETVARKYGVPVSAIMEANGFRDGAIIRPGQRLVIPRYVTASAAAPVAAAAPRADEVVHTVAPGESLIGIARHYGVTLSAIARVNKIDPYAKVSIGERITVPGGRRVAALRGPAPLAAPKVAAPRTTAVESAPPAHTPVQNARVVTPEPVATESVPKTAEAAGSLPSFRWPVKGRVIAAFGAKTNGAQNDGINLAVPEGTPIKAADDGVVAYAGNELKGYGNLVLVRHANGYVSAYANASELMVKRGDTVKRGQVIAHAGQTGNVTSPQLHFEIRKGSTPVDPIQFLDRGQG
jgi:murein DD-endopeptidase MepM/ murein hydrolase activator NlpD